MPITYISAPFGGEWYAKALAVRHEVMRAPLGLCYTPEELAHDAHYQHFVACDGDQVAANVSLALLDDRWAQIKQVAVHAGYERRGIGRALIHYVEDQARAQGYSRAFLNARVPTIGFYEKIGYVCEGDTFPLVGLPHQRMTKSL